jgi:hypothetical protein
MCKRSYPAFLAFEGARGFFINRCDLTPSDASGSLAAATFGYMQEERRR